MGSVGNGNGGKRSRAAATLILLGALLAGCSGASSVLDSSPGPTISGRFSNLFSSASDSHAEATAPKPTGPAFNDEDCPTVEVRSGAGTLAVATTTTAATANDLRYQLTFIQLARQCFLVGSNLNMKVGVQGRIVVGPAGAPNEIDVPLRFAVVREGVEPKTIVTKFKRLTLALPTGTLNQDFTDIEDDLTFPLPSRSELDSYVLYIGYDAATGNDKRPAPKAAKKPPAKRVN